jgi:hypothetical protein
MVCERWYVLRCPPSPAAICRLQPTLPEGHPCGNNPNQPYPVC